MNKYLSSLLNRYHYMYLLRTMGRSAVFAEVTIKKQEQKQKEKKILGPNLADTRQFKLARLAHQWTVTISKLPRLSWTLTKPPISFLLYLAPNPIRFLTMMIISSRSWSFFRGKRAHGAGNSQSDPDEHHHHRTSNDETPFVVAPPHLTVHLNPQRDT